MKEYLDFLASKMPHAVPTGIEAAPMPAHLFDFQAEGCRFMLRSGRAAGLYGTGMGKGRMALECCRQAAEATNGIAAHVVPLAVGRQIEKEGRELGYECRMVHGPDEVRRGTNIFNYDRLRLFDPRLFGAVSLDESDILASLTGATAQDLIEMFAETRFRFCWSATPAPNDHTELGAHSEFLGVMKAQEMLSRWFINDTSVASQSWRLKGHAHEYFWDWVASWARCGDTPYDLGFDGSAFVLPPFDVIKHHVEPEAQTMDGTLFGADLSAISMHAMKRKTAVSRAAITRDLVMAEPHEPWILWCDVDAEADALLSAIPSAVEVRGSHSPQRKEKTIFDFIEGRVKYLIAKPAACGAGLNLQHCARMAFIGRSFSYRRWYQAVRRAWRYGQKRKVQVHLIVAEGEDQIGRIIDRKAADHEVMKSAMAKAMTRARATVAVTHREYSPSVSFDLPSWLLSGEL
jgi:hypothetical protein